MEHWKLLARRGLALLLVLMMCVSMLPAAAFAEEADPEPEIVLEPDPEPEVILEPEADPEPEIALEPEADPEPEVILEPEADPEPEVVLEPEADPEPEVVLEPEADPEPEIVVEPEADPEPEVVLEPEAEPEVPADVRAFLDAVALLPESIGSDADLDAINAALERATAMYAALSEDGQDRGDVAAALMKLMNLAEQLEMDRPDTQALVTGEQFFITVNRAYSDGTKIGTTTVTGTCADGTGHSGYNHSMILSAIVSASGFSGYTKVLVKEYSYWESTTKYTSTSSYISSSVKPIIHYNITGSVPYKANESVWLISDVPSTAYTITYDANGGTGAPGQTKTASTSTSPKSGTLSSTRPTRDGYTFLGWSTSSTATVATYQPGGTYNFSSNTTLYAVWQKNPDPQMVTLTYIDRVVEYHKETVTANQDTVIVTCTNTRNGYTFQGWDTDPSATTVVYVPNDTMRITEDTTLYAVWQKNAVSADYTVHWYDADKNEEIKAEETRTATVGETVSAGASDQTVTGYTFVANDTRNVLTATLASSGTALKLYFRAVPTDVEWTVEWYKGYDEEDYESTPKLVEDTTPIKTDTVTAPKGTNPTVAANTYPGADGQAYPALSPSPVAGYSWKQAGWASPVVDSENRVITIKALWETTYTEKGTLYKNFQIVDENGTVTGKVDETLIPEDFSIHAVAKDPSTGAKLWEKDLGGDGTHGSWGYSIDYIVEHGYTLELTESNYEISGYTHLDGATLTEGIRPKPTPAVMINCDGVHFGSVGRTKTWDNKYTLNTQPNLPAPDLTIEKTVDKTSAKVGGTLNYTITVKNNGAAAATGVTVKDTLPEQLSFDQKSPSDFEWTLGSNNTVTWDVGEVKAGETKTITFQAKAEKAGVAENHATVTGDDLEDLTTENPAKTTIHNLTVTKENGGFQVDQTAGTATVHYTVTVKNNSGFALHGLEIIDTLKPTVSGESTVVMTLKPTSLKLNGADVGTLGENSAPSSTETSVRTWKVLDRSVEFPNNGVVTLEYDIVVRNTGTSIVHVALNNTARGGSWTTPAPEIAAFALFSAGDDDYIYEEGSSKADLGGSTAGGLIPPSSAPVSVVKTADKNSAKAGETVEYTVVITNLTDEDKVVGFQDVMAAGLTMTAGGMTIDGSPFNADSIAIPAKGSVTIKYSAVVSADAAAGTKLGNTATATLDGKDYSDAAEVTVTETEPPFPNVTLKYVDENGRELESKDLTVGDDGSYNAETIPEEITKDGTHYVKVRVDGAPAGTVSRGGSDVTVTVTYAKDTLRDPEKDLNGDEPGDGIPDSMQFTVNYRAVNGAVTPASTVVTRLDGEGNPSAGGTATLAGHLPSASPNAGFTGGRWDVTPTADTVIDRDTTFTITYTPADAGTRVITVNYVDEDGARIGGTQLTAPAGQAGQVTASTVPAAIDSGDNHYVLNDTLPKYVPANVSSVNVIFALDNAGGPGGNTPDGIPDSRQAIVYYYSSNTAYGTVARAYDVFTVDTAHASRDVTLSNTAETGASSRYYFSSWTQDGSRLGTALTLNAGFTVTGGRTYDVYANFGRSGGSGGGGSSSGGGSGSSGGSSSGGSGTAGATTTINDEATPLAGDLQLNKQDHFAYIKGYSDGTVRPNNPITRAQVATIFYRLLDATSRAIYFQDSNDFSDVADTYWANKAISTLSNAGIITGFSDGTFRPDANITRAQFAAIAARFDDVVPGLDNPFSDVAEDYWARDLIAYAADRGWITGENGRFRPTEDITRVEVMDFINNVLERHVDEEGILEDATQWSDSNPGDWYYFVVLEATNSHDFERRNEGELMEDWTQLNPDPVWDE